MIEIYMTYFHFPAMIQINIIRGRHLYFILVKNVYHDTKLFTEQLRFLTYFLQITYIIATLTCKSAVTK